MRKELAYLQCARIHKECMYSTVHLTYVQYMYSVLY